MRPTALASDGHLLELFHGQAEPLGELDVGGRPAVLGLELLAGLFHLGGLGPDQAGNPVHGPQLVEHGPADSGDAVGLELDARGSGRTRRWRPSGRRRPAEIRSSRSTPSGRRCQIRSALYLTRGKYRSTSWFRKSVVGCSLNSRQSSVTSTSTLVDILTSMSAEREDAHPCVRGRAIDRPRDACGSDVDRSPGPPWHRRTRGVRRGPPSSLSPSKELDPNYISDNPTNRLERHSSDAIRKSRLSCRLLLSFCEFSSSDPDDRPLDGSAGRSLSDPTTLRPAGRDRQDRHVSEPHTAHPAVGIDARSDRAERRRPGSQAPVTGQVPRLAAAFRRAARSLPSTSRRATAVGIASSTPGPPSHGPPAQAVASDPPGRPCDLPPCRQPVSLIRSPPVPESAGPAVRRSAGSMSSGTAWPVVR